MRNLMVATSLALILAACGGGSDDSAPATNAEKPSAETSIADHAENMATEAAEAGEIIADEAKEAASNIQEATENVAEKAEAEISDAVSETKEALAEATENVSEATLLAMLPAPYSEADAEAGGKVFRQCKSCHLVNDSGKNLVGPNLYGVIGANAGHVENFNYSKAMKESGITWTPEHIDAYLASPRKYVEGNRMSFVGLAKEKDRQNVIAYLAVSGGIAPTE